MSESGEQPRGACPPSGTGPLPDAMYRQMIDAVLDYAIFYLDAEGLVRSWNAGARILKGYEADEVIGRHFSIFYPPDLIASRWPERELELARESGRFEDEGWRVRKDGSQMWANVIITRITDASGAVCGYCKVTRDLTERRKQEELLRQSEERFRMLVDSVQDYAIFMLDPAGRIASWNAGAERAKGYAAAEIIGQHFSIFYPPDVAANGWPSQELELALRDGRLEDEGWRIRKDGSRFWASVVITPIHGGGGQHLGFAKVTRDLTERRKIHALEDEGRRITTFIAMLAHELRNPLAPIVSALSVMQMEQMESRSLRMARDVLVRQLDQMIRLVNDLLDVGRITSGKIQIERKPMDLSGALHEAIEVAGPLMRAKSQTLTLKDSSAAAWVAGDRARIVQIFGNLLSNAAKFTPEGGRINVAVSAHDDRVEVSVKDNGPGIPPAQLKNVFNLFVQGEQDLARSKGGLGLGLSLVHQLVKLHGGDVTAYSVGQAGMGSEFVITLPAIPSPDANPGPASSPAPTLKGKILVVDDNVDAANMLVVLLRDTGYQASAAYSGETALAAVRTNAPAVVLLDIGMPELNGYQVAQAINTQMADPPKLVALTGYGQAMDREATTDAGFHAHLVKPAAIAELIEVLNRLLG
ncbi:MAG: PAS domain S-box protein [Tahibacter sp.]